MRFDMVCDVTPCGLVYVHQSSERTCCLYFSE